MKILITGSKGMLAQEIAEVFSGEELSPAHQKVSGANPKDKWYGTMTFGAGFRAPKTETVKTIGANSWSASLFDREELDITDEDAVSEIVKRELPDAIINCAAYTDVEKAEEEREEAMAVNARAVGNLARVAAENNAIFVHFSTDYVFDGRKKDGYKEDETPKNPVNFYGISKLAGESEILNVAQYKDGFRYYLIRTSWVFGAGGKNFVETVTSLSLSKPELRVVDDQIGKPTYALDLARATKTLLEKKYPFGIYHIVNDGAVTWYNYARKILELKGINVSVKPQSAKDSGAKAARPQHSILLNTKFPPLRPWQEALEEYLE